MTEIVATQSTIAAAWKQLQPGDTLRLEGQFSAFRPIGKDFRGKAPAIIDATNADLTDWSGAKLGNIVFQGGVWRPGTTHKVGLRLDSSYDCVFDGLAFEGKDPAVGTGLSLYVGGGHRVEGSRVRGGMRIGLQFAELTALDVLDTDCVGVGSDAIDLFGVVRGLVDGADLRDFRPVPGAHSDGVQFDSHAGRQQSEDITIRRVRVHGQAQGIFGAKVKGLLIEHCDVTSSFANGISASQVDGLVIRDNVVRTVPGAPAQSRIVVRDGCTDVVQQRNRVEAHGAWKQIYDPDYVPPKPAEPAKPVAGTIDVTMTQGGRTYAGTLTERLT